jgi:hypothetical protein
MKIDDRTAQSDQAFAAMNKKLAAFPDLDVATIHVNGNEETNLLHAVTQKLTSIPVDRLAGIIAVTDGEIHDKVDTDFPAPLHVLIAGHHDEVDRRISIKEAPAYGIVGKHVSLTLHIEDQPSAQSAMAAVTFHRDNGESAVMNLPVGKDVSFDVPIDHAGQNLFVFSTEALPHELTSINNTIAVSVNGIRDRLRVLLISGQPHIGGRTWRNFLKADPAVDLVHFTILRSPTKLDMTSNTELALITFPVHELFEVKLKSFDLVIFDRFSNQSLVPDDYLQNLATYVENGGALLVSNATDHAIPPLTSSPLARILPTELTGRLLTGSFRPELTAEGSRHPVTRTLGDVIPRNNWGHWFRQIEGQATKGEVLMSGLNHQPLLVLNHVGKGRIAQFLSDQFWLWSRGFEGGGPQAEMLRRVAHWLVQEPELDETALRAQADMTDSGWQIGVSKQSLHDNSTVVQITAPDHQTSSLTLTATKQQGILSAVAPVTGTGLYHVKDNDQEILVMVGPTHAAEFGAMVATESKLAPYVKATNGRTIWLADQPDGPAIHRTNADASQNGHDWIGLKKNGQYRVTGSKAYPLWPGWLAILVLLAAVMVTWRREGRR